MCIYIYICTRTIINHNIMVLYCIILYYPFVCYSGSTPTTSTCRSTTSTMAPPSAPTSARTAATSSPSTAIYIYI